MTARTREIEIQLAAEKEQLRTSLAKLSARANDAIDWRQQFRRHPGAMLGAAVVAGVALGAATGAAANGRARGSDPKARGDRRRSRHDASFDAWERVKFGVAGMLADRAIVAAGQLMDGLLDGARGERRSDRTR